MKELRNQFVMRPDFRPMLAAGIKDMTKLTLPKLATPKLDGIRCVTREKQILDLFGKSTVEAVSRSLTSIPNRYVQQVLGEYDLTGLDGELITYTDGVMDEYYQVESKIMSRDGTPDFKFHVFDLVEPLPYWDRMEWLKDKLVFPETSRLLKVLPVLIQSIEQLNAYEEACLQLGFEGVMLRDIDGPYKFGRSTFNQQWLLKLKRFEDAEATIIGFEELMVNGNEAVTNALGLSERSSHKANLIPGGKLGALIVVGHNGVQFNIGTGFNDEQRRDIWMKRDSYKCKLVKFKYQPHGQKDAPRCPVFLGFREDMEVI